MLSENEKSFILWWVEHGFNVHYDYDYDAFKLQNGKTNTYISVEILKDGFNNWQLMWEAWRNLSRKLQPDQGAISTLGAVKFIAHTTNGELTHFTVVEV